MTEAHLEAERAIHKNARRDWITVGLAALIVVLVGYNGWLQHASSMAADAARSNAVSLAEQVQRACLDSDVIVSDQNVCDRADEVADEPAAPAPPKGDPGEPGRAPTLAEIAAAVAAQLPTEVRAYCDSRGNCRGPQGEPGPESTIPGPSGRDGVDGVPGANGNDGAAGRDGAPGPGPTDEQVRAAVTTFCTASPGACQGMPGESIKGDTGPAGIDGRGVGSVICQPDTSWLITYTDGATSTTPGPCSVAVITPPIDPAPED